MVRTRELLKDPREVWPAGWKQVAAGKGSACWLTPSEGWGVQGAWVRLAASWARLVLEWNFRAHSWR